MTASRSYRRNGKKRRSSGSRGDRANELDATSELDALSDRVRELEAAEAGLRASEARYRDLFDASPISIWQADWSAVKTRIDTLRAEGVTDVVAYFRDNPAAVRAAVASIRVTAFNRATLTIYRAPSAEALWKGMDRFLNKTYWDEFHEVVAGLASKSARHVIECRERAFDGTDIFVRIVRQVPAEHRNSWSLVIETVEDITDKRRAEAALRTSEARFDFTERAARTGHWVWDERAGRVEFISDELANIFGVPRDRLAELATDWLALIHPEDRAKARAIVDEAQHKRRGYELDYRTRRPDGEIRFLHETCDLVADEQGELVRTVGIVQDVTERKRVEEELVDREHRLRASEARASRAEQRLLDAIESISEGFVLYDADDRLVLYNRKWLNLYGYSEDRVKPGIRYEDLVRLDIELGAIDTGVTTPEEYIRTRTAYRRKFRGAYDVPLADGRWITIRERETSDGGIVGIQADITEAKRAERALTLAKEDAEIANRAKSEFLANMSHELRTPLNAIIGFSEMIRNAAFGPVGDDKYVEYAEDIRSSGQHLLGVISDILDISKIEAGKLDLVETIVDVGRVIGSCASLVRERAWSRNLTINHEVSAQLPELLADERKLKQILINLLSNALKFTPDGGRIGVSARLNEAGGVVLAVADTGIGIAKADMATVLSPFGQVEHHLERRHEGTGLGLPLTKALVELHGGALELRSEAGQGTEVRIVFPPSRTVPPHTTSSANT